MKRTFILFAAGAVAVAPAAGLAAPPTSGSLSPNTSQTGQPGVECDEPGGTAPSQSGREPGPGSPFQEDSVSGSKYAGEQAGINDKNTASVSQYDIACFRGSTRPSGG